MVTPRNAPIFAKMNHNLRYIITCLASAVILSACDESQSITEFSNDAVIDLDFHVVINDEDIGNINLQFLKNEIETLNSNLGNEQSGIPVSKIIQRVYHLSDEELDAFLNQYICDYQSNEDGFRPSSKGERCPLVSCLETKRSYVNAYSGSIFYGESAPMTNGCYNVKNISNEDARKKNPVYSAGVYLYTANPNSQLVWIYLNGEKLGRSVDLDTLDKTVTNGQESVLISDIFEKAQIPQDLNNYLCDFRVGDDLHTLGTQQSICAPDSCESIKTQSIAIDNISLLPPKDICQADHIKAIYVTEQVSSYESYHLTINVDGSVFAVIDLASLKPKAVVIDNNEVVYLSDIFEAAGLEIDESSALCDYVSEDGYRPSDKDSCKAIRTCEDASSAYISLYAHNLHIENANSCYNVGDIASIEIATHQNQSVVTIPYNVLITQDGNKVGEIDLSTLSDQVIDKDGKQVLYVSSIISAAIPGFDFEHHYCDTFASDGWKPSVQDKCAEIFKCTYMQQAYIDITDIENRQIIPPDGVPSCYATKYLQEIIIYSNDPN